MRHLEKIVAEYNMFCEMDDKVISMMETYPDPPAWMLKLHKEYTDYLQKLDAERNNAIFHYHNVYRRILSQFIVQRNKRQEPKLIIEPSENEPNESTPQHSHHHNLTAFSNLETYI